MNKPAFSKKTNEEKRTLLVIRLLTAFFMGALIISGITAFPLKSELSVMCNILGIVPGESAENYEGLKWWIAWINEGIVNTNFSYPFLAYGTDWLAFAHIIIAIAFVGVFRKPARNVWIVYWAMIACVLIIPTVLICGSIRQIPFFWQLVDCSFGVFGLIPLYVLLVYIKRLEKISCYVPSEY